VKPDLRSSSFSPQRVLVILPTWVGDFVMATPMLRAVRQRFAGARITFLGEANLGDLIDGGDWMDEVLALPPKDARRPWHAATRAMIRTLRERAFDLAILLPNSFRSAMTAWQAGAKRRVGFHRDGRGWLLTDRVPCRNRAGRRFTPYPIVEYYADLAEAIGCPHPGDRLELFTTPACDASLRAKLATVGVREDAPLVVISPGAKFGASKCWAPDRFAAAADLLAERHAAVPVITCGPGEEAIARTIASAMRHKGVVFDEPRLSLGELKSLIRRCTLLLCNDAGPRHLAKAFGVPVVTVFGPTHPEWTATAYPQERIVRIDVECGPCQQKICPLGHHQCMTGVSVAMVYEACAALLGGARSLPRFSEPRV
jgi:heptosyltransferase-2